jgi:NOL1/NOP2/fmu family ribosome biogenesis protein
LPQRPAPPPLPVAQSPRLLFAAALLAGFVLLSAIIFYIKTNHGTIVVEIDDPSISVTVQGEDIQITKNDSDEAYQIKPGEHTLHVKHGDLEFDTDKFNLRRGEEVALSVRFHAGQVQVRDGNRVIGRFDVPTNPSTNYALAFDGQSDYIDISSFHYDGGHPLTIETTVVLNSSRKAGVLCDAQGGGISLECNGNHVWSFYAEGVGGYAIAKSSTKAPTQTRTHLAGVIDGLTTRLYIDSKLFGVAQIANRFVPSNEPMLIGANPQPADELQAPFHGIIDEVRISNVARYDNNFTPAERFEPDEHTLALYHFDEGQGEIAHDSSPNKHHGKIVGAKWVRAATTEEITSDRSNAQWFLQKAAQWMSRLQRKC